MKKRILAFVLAVNCAVFMTACGDSEIPTLNEVRDKASEEDASSQDSGLEENTAEDAVSEQSTQADTEETKDEEAEEISAPNTPATLSDNIYDYQISIDGTVYQFPMWYSDFKALGWELDGDNTETLASNQTGVSYWKKDGISVTVVLANLSMNMAAFSDCMVSGIEISKYDLKNCNWEILLPGGIQYGVSTTDDILAAYGDPTFDFDSSLFYDMVYQYDYFDEIHLFVFKDSGVLEQIKIENLVELEGADNSVSAEVPDIIKDYQAPTELGNDLYGFNFELEGNLYKLPCPVSEFLANGFTIDESNTDMEIGSGSKGWIALKYNNQTLKVQVKNFADYATTVENCMLIEVSSSDYGPDLALTIPYNIKRGDSEASVLKAIKGYNVDKFSQDGGYMHYTIREPGGSSLDGYYICVKNGFVHSIEVTNFHMPE